MASLEHRPALPHGWTHRPVGKVKTQTVVVKFTDRNIGGITLHQIESLSNPLEPF